MGYQEISTIEALAEIIESSDSHPVLFFKHSNTCGTSQRALLEFQKYLHSPEGQSVSNFLVIVQSARAVSNELERLLSIRHESPQAILVKGRQAIWHDSHLALKSDNLRVAVSQN